MSPKTLQGFTQTKPKGSRNHKAFDGSGSVQEAQREESRFASLDLIDCDWQGGNLPYEKNSK